MSNENKEWIPGMDMGFKIGDTAYYGGIKGEVFGVIDGEHYPVKWKGGKIKQSFTKDGRSFIEHKIPSLFFKPQTYDISRPAWEPKSDEWCWFWDKSIPILAKFDCISGNFFKAKDNDTWLHCAQFKGELPEHLKNK